MVEVSRKLRKKLIDSVEAGMASREAMAYLDLAVEYGRLIVVAGESSARTKTTNLVCELAEKYGDVTRVYKVETLKSIFFGESGYNKNDFVLASLTEEDSNFITAYFDALNSRNIKGIAEMAVSDLDNIIVFLESRGVDRYFISAPQPLYIITADKPPQIKEISETADFDRITKIIHTLCLYRGPPEDGKDTSGFDRSYVLRDAKAKLGLSKKSFWELLEEREKSLFGK